MLLLPYESHQAYSGYPGYVYGLKDDNIYVNLFMNSNTTLSVHGKSVNILQQNNYPWEGGLKFTVSPKGTDA